jgi:hypothetical protein
MKEQAEDDDDGEEEEEVEAEEGIRVLYSFVLKMNIFII